MPELPEVHTIVNDLKKSILGWTIADIKVLGTNVKVPFSIKGKKIKNIRRIAKNIVIDLKDQSLVIHLAMTGRLLLRSPTYKGTDKYLKALFTLKKGQKTVHLKFCNKRGWAKIKLKDEIGLEKLEQKYGIDPLGKKLTPSKLFELIQTKSTNIKTFLMNQSVIAGMGNAYVTEALWLAQMHPEKRTKDITQKQAETLLKAIRAVLKEGIKNRGLSINDYVDVFGKPGNQQDFLKVYRQETCPKCKKKVNFKKIGGRGTYFCPTCQKK